MGLLILEKLMHDIEVTSGSTLPEMVKKYLDLLTATSKSTGSLHFTKIVTERRYNGDEFIVSFYLTDTLG